jgi:hypothetical protein
MLVEIGMSRAQETDAMDSILFNSFCAFLANIQKFNHFIFQESIA